MSPAAPAAPAGPMSIPDRIREFLAGMARIAAVAALAFAVSMASADPASAGSQRSSGRIGGSSGFSSARSARSYSPAYATSHGSSIRQAAGVCPDLDSPETKTALPPSSTLQHCRQHHRGPPPPPLAGQHHALLLLPELWLRLRRLWHGRIHELPPHRRPRGGCLQHLQQHVRRWIFERLSRRRG